MFRRAVAVVALLLAGALVVSPVTLSFWHSHYSHSVERVSAGDVPEEADVLAYDSLSSDAQRVVRKAVESDDGHYAVYRERNAPDEFFYSDHAELGQGIYYVEYQGVHYELSTYAAGGFPFVYWFYEGLLVAFGAILGTVARPTFRGDRSPWVALALSLFAVALLLGGPLTRFPVGEGVWRQAVLFAPLVDVGVVLAPRIRASMAATDR